MTDRFVEVILPAVEKLKLHNSLKIETDDLSTLVRGEATEVFAAIRDAFMAAAASGSHVVANVLFSRGCPGEEQCEADASVDQGGYAPGVELDPVADIAQVEAAAQYSLYPLGREDYMEQIYGAVAEAKKTGSFTRSKNFCTRLDGPADKLFETIFESFVGAPASHAVIHATISANSPSKKGETR
jgi:uncharacterized protein YqgV (UPF0045/DUF77 family)